MADRGQKNRCKWEKIGKTAELVRGIGVYNNMGENELADGKVEIRKWDVEIRSAWKSASILSD